MRSDTLPSSDSDTEEFDRRLPVDSDTDEFESSEEGQPSRNRRLPVIVREIGEKIVHFVIKSCNLVHSKSMT